MASSKRLKTDSSVELGSSNDPLIESPSEEAPKRKIPKRTNSLESKVDPPTSASSSSPKEPNDADKDDATQKKPDVEKPQTNMLDMNDQALREMLDRMDLPELCITAEVSVQLKEIAQEVFTAKHRNVSLTSLANPNGKYTLAKARQLLYNFGHLINVLEIDDTRLDDSAQFPKLLTLVLKYCTETVEEVVFLNHPGDNMVSVIQTLMFGQNIFLRGLQHGQGRYKNMTKTTFATAKIIQEQILLPDP